MRQILDGHKVQTRRLSTRVQVGDVLWVREAWAKPFAGDDGYIYRADGTEFLSMAMRRHNWGAEARWTSPRFMPREASRLSLYVTGLHYEPLQDITWQDVIDEGIDVREAGTLIWQTWSEEKKAGVARDAFRRAWDAIHRDRVGGTWADNPDVAVVTFRIHDIRR